MGGLFAGERVAQPPFIAALAGAAGGALLVLVAVETGPAMILALLVALGVAAAVLSRPWLGLMLCALVIPLERLGRFTDDASMYTVSLMRITGLLALGSFLLHALIKRERLKYGAAFFLYAAYCVFGGLTLFHSEDPPGTVRASSAIAGNLLFFFLVINVTRSWRLARWSVAAWLAGTVLCGIYTLYDWHLGARILDESTLGQTEARLSTVWRDASEWESLSNVPRAMGTSSHAAVYGINLILTLPFFAYFIKVQSSRRARLLAAAGLAIVGYNVFLTNTRAAILLAVGVILLSMWRRLIPLKPSVLGAGLACALLMLPLVPEAVYTRVLDPSNYQIERSGTLRVRFEYWRAALAIVEDHWLTGVGLGDQVTVSRYATVAGLERGTVHNEFLQTLVEVGVFGWLALFGFVGLIVWSSIEAGAILRRLQDGEEQYWFMVACQIALVAALLYGLQVDVLHFPLKGWWLVAGLSWVMCGAAGRELLRRREQVRKAGLA